MQLLRENQIDEALCILSKERRIAADIETTGLNPHKDQVAVLSLYGKESDTAAILHLKGNLPAPVRAFLSDPEKHFIYHNGLSFDLRFLANTGVEVLKPEYYDTLIGEQIALTSGRANVSKSLKATLKRRLKKEIDKDQGKSSWMHATLTDEQVKYCIEDIIMLHDTRNAQIIECSRDTRFNALKIETKLIPIILEMELNGLPIDLKALATYRIEEARRAEESRSYLQKLAPDFRYYPKTMSKKQRALKEMINLNSPAEIKALLHHLGYMVQDTKKDTLLELATLAEDTDARAYTVFNSIVTGRQGNKRSSMYDEEWIEDYAVIKHGYWYVHASFNPTSTDTLRFSSDSPNLQQIPKNMRKVFVAPPGYKYVSCDYAQLEAWIAAGLAQDEAYMEALLTGDVHSAVASQIYHLDLTEFLELKKKDKDKFNKMRKNGKFCNFLLLFGGGAAGLRDYALAAGSMMDLEEATIIVNRFLEAYPQIAQDRASAHQIAATKTFENIILPSGARRVLGGELKPTQILNTRVQGTAACGLKFALLECQKRGLTSRLGATVHDELVAIVPEEDALEYGEELKAAMIAGMQRAIPLPVQAELKIGDSWQE